MKEDKLKKLAEELKYLKEEERQKELESCNIESNLNVKELAKEIYDKRGIDYSKLNTGLFNNIGDSINEFATIFKNSDAKGKMVLDILYMVILVVFIKVPFDLVRDVGYDYIELLSTNNVYYKLWNLLFLIIYTIVLICTLIVLIKNFIKKYRDSK